MSFPKVLDKEVPTRLVGVSAEFQEDLGNGFISRDLRRAFTVEGAGLSDRATVTTVEEGSEWSITDLSEKLLILLPLRR